MKVEQSLVLVVFIFSSCQGWLFSGPEWDSLRVTWGVNPFSSSTFAHLPRTASEAVSKGFVKISDCDTSAAWRGSRYVKGGDYSVILLFDVNGYIAGLQTGVPRDLPDGYPSIYQRPPFVNDGSRYVMSAYFVNPSIICTSGRTADEFEEQGTGTNLYIQNSTVPEHSFLVPRDEADLTNTAWTEGKCFVTMGNHYWYDARLDAECDKFFPAFLMYNDGKLNAFGFAFTTFLESPRYEYPPQSAFGHFFKVIPTCLKSVPKVTTMHIYFSNPYSNFC